MTGAQLPSRECEIQIASTWWLSWAYFTEHMNIEPNS
jgi:hypothetical protein